ncbi:MAG TPA: hypothetical protein VIR56_00495 [Solimonas sp.]
MSLRYFDSEAGRERFKRRYVWAMWSFGGGLLCGLILAATMH